MIWVMQELQIESVLDPFAGDGGMLRQALALLTRAQMMSLLPAEAEHTRTLDYDLLVAFTRKLAHAGVATGTAVSVEHIVPRNWKNVVERDELKENLVILLDALNQSPYPAGEWGPARELLEDELLAALVGTSTSSVRRYASNERKTPDAVAWRLHAIARILSALRGAYNAYGIRRWFTRPRSALDGRTPAQVIIDGESESDLGPVIALAESLHDSGSAI
jgi:hypothetical protein